MSTALAGAPLALSVQICGRRKQAHHSRQFTHWRWRPDEMYETINGQMHYPWRAAVHEGEVLESFVGKGRDKVAALRFIKRMIERHGRPKAIITDGLRSYRAALKALGAPGSSGDRSLEDQQRREL